MKSKHQIKKDLIIIEIDGVTHELWGLVKLARDKRQQWQFDADYIPSLKKQLKDKNPKKVAEAQEALIFLNASVMAELDGNFKHLSDLGVEPSDEFKKDIYNSRNASQRDYVSNNQGAQDELSDVINHNSFISLGEAQDTMKALKKAVRKSGRSVSTLYKSKINQSEELKNQQLTKEPTIYTSEEVMEFQVEYDKQNKPKNSRYKEQGERKDEQEGI